MTELIISVSGLRGVVGENLTADVATCYTRAVLASLPPGPIVVTRDGRGSGPALAAAIDAAVTATGRTCLDAGVAATPTAGVLVRAHHAAGGIQISASHNPPEYNGIKLFSAAGRLLPEPAGRAIRDRFLAEQRRMGQADAAASPPPAGKASVAGGEIKSLDDTVRQHAALVEGTVDRERIRARRFRVLLDANHGAGSLLGRFLLDRLGCDLTLLGGTPDGRFAHRPEPTQANLAGVLAAIRKAGADIGFCQDPDADRLAVIDREGHYLGEEFTLAMCVDHVLSRRPGPIVANCSTSRMAQDIASRYGVPFFRSAVGEANVVDAMVAHDAVLGGEGNGGVIDPRVGLVRDSFAGMALLLDAMATRQATVADLAAGLPHYAIHKTKVHLPPARVADGLVRVQARFPNATADRLDGLRLDWSDRWLLVRASNTEPIVRIVAEAPTGAQAKTLCDQAGQALEG